MTRTAGARRPRPALGRADWIAAGQQLLIDGGVPAVKLASLTQELGVTSGSFYHHFADFREYLDALADHYGHDNVERVLGVIEPVTDPAERLRLLWTLREEWDFGRLDAAMRVWAVSDRRARGAVARLDDKLIELVHQAFADLGYDLEQARVRAMLAYTAGVGQPFLFGRAVNALDAAAALELLVGGRP